MNNILRFLDIGAANFKLDKRWINSGCEIMPVLFEPDPRSFKFLKDNNIEVYNFALGNLKSKCKLNLTRKEACSSFLYPNIEFLSKFPNPERWDIIDEVFVEVRTLDSFGLDVDFMKIDTQGTELDILNGAEETLSSVLGIELEVSFSEIYKNQPLFGDLHNYLANKGFEFFEFVTEYRYGRDELDRSGQLVFADALFLRSPEYIKNNIKHKEEKYKTIAKAYCKEDLIMSFK